MTQFPKASSTIVVTELGIMIEVRLEQFQNALTPILVTEFGIIEFIHPVIKVLDFVSIMALQLFLLSYLLFPSSMIIEVRPEQAENAPVPIFVTEFGIVIDVRLEQ